jgi:hypothetical protein
MRITIEHCGFVRTVTLPEDVQFESFCTALFDLAASTYGWGAKHVLRQMLEYLEARVADEERP